MRVLHVIPSVAPRYGGPSYAVVGFCRALNALGVDTLMATTNADGDQVLPVPTQVSTRYQGVEAVFFPRLGEAFKYSGTLSRWLRGAVSDFDVVHVHAVFSHASLAAGRACRLRHVPYIVRPLGSLDPWSLAQRAWKKRVLMTSVRTLLREAAAIHFTTDEEQQLAAPRTGATKGVVIPPGVDDAYLAQAPIPAAERDLRITALTRLDRKKRLEALIESFHKVAVGPLALWRLTIAGEGDTAYRAELERRAAGGAAAGRIDFPGWIDGDPKRRLLRESALFALPSHQENFGIGLLEALACGVPAIVSRAVNLSPAVMAAGAGWVIGDADTDLSAALRTAMTSVTDRERRGRAAQTLAARFTWAASAKRLDALYSSLRAMPAESRR